MLIVAALVGLYFIAGDQPANIRPGGADPAPVTDADHIRGNLNAAVTLMEYGDFQCPACGQYEPFLQEMLDTYGNDIRFVYRHFPLEQIHANARRSARATEAAHQQGKFWEMHDLLFERQAEWSEESPSRAEEKFLAYAQELGLDLERFEQDFDADLSQEPIDRDLADAKAIGLNSTPSLFINGEYIKPTGFNELEQMIKDAINPPASTPTPEAQG